MSGARESILFTSIYLLLYIILINIGIPLLFAGLLAIIWQFTLLWMIYCILKDDKIKYPQFNDGTEWGYADKNSNKLGMF